MPPIGKRTYAQIITELETVGWVEVTKEEMGVWILHIGLNFKAEIEALPNGNLKITKKWED
jgi:hypothetical protein